MTTTHSGAGALREAFEKWWHPRELVDWRGHNNTHALTAWEAWQACAALSAAQEAPAQAVQAVPEGWKLVPIAGSPEIADAIAKATGGGYGAGYRAYKAWAAALASAPAAPAQESSADGLDAKRYRWLRENCTRLGVNVELNGNGPEIEETLDEAIDAAIAASKA